MHLRQLSELFIFSSKERNGILLLLTILFLILCMDLMLPYIIPGKEFDTTAWSAEAEKFYAETSTGKVADRITFEGVIDPNSPGAADLAKAGIPDRVAANWIKYLQKGGHFKKKEDLLKLYGMTPEIFSKVERYLRISEKVEPVRQGVKLSRGVDHPVFTAGRRESVPAERSEVKVLLPMLELNRADSVQLEALPGIGPVLASRIIKYRRLLGGFYDVAQLKEIYGMSEELWEKSSPGLRADPAEIKRIELNFLSLSELGRHPYIGFRQAKRIVKRRDVAGKFSGTEDLASLFSPDSLQRLLPYLSTGEGKP